MHSDTVEIIQSPQSQSVCEGETVNFACVVMFVTGRPGSAIIWLADSANSHDASGLPGHSVSNNSYGQLAPANITSVLTVTNVNISNNGTGYTCVYSDFFMRVSDTAGFLIVLGEALKCLLTYQAYGSFVYITAVCGTGVQQERFVSTVSNYWNVCVRSIAYIDTNICTYIIQTYICVYSRTCVHT